jgi:hypothetical protein
MREGEARGFRDSIQEVITEGRTMNGRGHTELPALMMKLKSSVPDCRDSMTDGHQEMHGRGASQLDNIEGGAVFDAIICETR